MTFKYVVKKSCPDVRDISHMYVFFKNGDFFKIRRKEIMDVKLHLYDNLILHKREFLPVVLCLVSAALAINILVLVIRMVNTAVLYTVENGGVLVLSAIYSFIFFKEKPQLLKVIGIILAAVSITVLSI